MTYLFHLGCTAGVPGSDLQTGLTYPGVDEEFIGNKTESR